MMMFAASIASRGIKNKKIDIPTKQLRVVSCFGYNNIAPCPGLGKSQFLDHHYCTKCGCGDKPTTWLLKNSTNYSKLDYPKLSCPLKMPGFTNYDPNFYDLETKERKQQIESLDPNELSFIEITIGVSEEKEKLIEKLNNILDNS